MIQSKSKLPPEHRQMFSWEKTLLQSATVLTLALGVPLGVQAQHMILAWGDNKPEWRQKIGISGIRAGCSDAPASCARDVDAIESSQQVHMVFLAVRLNDSSVSYAREYSNLSRSHPALYEVGIDDFVSQAEKLHMDSAHLGGLLNQVIGSLKSQNANLHFGVTIYDDQLAKELPNLGLNGDFLQQVEFVHLFPHYRKKDLSDAEYVKQAKAIFPRAQIIGGVYPYDRRDYLPCVRGGSAACSNEEEVRLFTEDAQAEVQLLGSGAIAGIEFYPAFFGNEEKWKGWQNPRSCRPERLQECIANEKTMRDILPRIMNVR